MATGMMQPKPEPNGTYSYSSQPRPVQQDTKYRQQSVYGNIMYDRRIVRGNTYALHTLPASSQPDPLELQRQQESRRRALARKRAREQFKPRSPEPVNGRKHIEVQTELYLEEITDRVEEADVQTQTDAFLDRPSTPLFVPAKTGMDTATQIEDGDLFDFDIEVRPILEVLVGKVVEQSLLEVMEEEEFASLRAQQRLFEENRNAEVVETQRLEEQERRRREEKIRRIQQQKEALLKEKDAAEKVESRAFAQSYIKDLVPAVFSILNQNGFFYDPVEKEVETVFMPFLMEETEKSLNKKLVARTLLDAIVRNMVAKKLGIELTEPEPSQPADKTPPQPNSRDEQATKGDTQQQQIAIDIEQKKVFGDEKEPEEKVPTETGEGEMAPASLAVEDVSEEVKGAAIESEEREDAEVPTKEGELEKVTPEKEEKQETEEKEDTTGGDQATDGKSQGTEDTMVEMKQGQKTEEIEEKAEDESSQKEKVEDMSNEEKESENAPATENEVTPAEGTNAESAEGPPVASNEQS